MPAIAALLLAGIFDGLDKRDEREAASAAAASASAAEFDMFEKKQKLLAGIEADKVKATQTLADAEAAKKTRQITSGLTLRNDNESRKSGARMTLPQHDFDPGEMVGGTGAKKFHYFNYQENKYESLDTTQDMNLDQVKTMIAAQNIELERGGSTKRYFPVLKEGGSGYTFALQDYTPPPLKTVFSREEAEKEMEELNAQLIAGDSVERYSMVLAGQNKDGNQYELKLGVPKKAGVSLADFTKKLKGTGVKIGDLELTFGEDGLIKSATRKVGKGGAGKTYEAIVEQINKMAPIAGFTIVPKGLTDGGFVAEYKPTPEPKKAIKTRAEATKEMEELKKTTPLEKGKQYYVDETASGYVVGIRDVNIPLDPLKMSREVNAKGDPIPFGAGYWGARAQGGDGSTFEVFDMTPDGTGLVLGRPVLDDAGKKIVQSPDSQALGREGVLVWERKAYKSLDTGTVVANQLVDFFTTFDGKTIQRAFDLQQAGTNTTAFPAIKDLLVSLVANYNSTGVTTSNTDIIFRNLVSDGAFNDQLNMLGKVANGALLNAVTNQVTADIQTNNVKQGLPANTPTNSDGPNFQIPERTSIIASSLVIRKEDGAVEFTPATVDLIKNLTANGIVSAGKVLDLLSIGQIKSDPSTTGSPEGVAGLAESAEELYQLLSTGKTAQTGGGPGSKQTTATLGTPTMGSRDKDTFRRAVGSLATLEDRLLLLEAVLPKSVVKSFKGRFLKDDSPAGVYEAISGAANFIKIGDTQTASRKTMKTVLNINNLLAGGAQTGAVGSLAKIKDSILYTVDQVMEEVFNDGGEELSMFAGEAFTDKDTGKTYSSATTYQQIMSQKRAELSEKLNSSDEKVRQNALLKFNLTVLSYSYAAMLDPNGRLSDADREAADRAIGNSAFATPTQIKAVAEAIYKSANMTNVKASAYLSGSPERVYAMKMYDENSSATTTIPVEEFIKSFIPTNLSKDKVVPENETLTDDANESLGAVDTPPLSRSFASSPRFPGATQTI